MAFPKCGIVMCSRWRDAPPPLFWLTPFSFFVLNYFSTQVKKYLCSFTRNTRTKSSHKTPYFWLHLQIQVDGDVFSSGRKTKCAPRCKRKGHVFLQSSRKVITRRECLAASPQNGVHPQPKSPHLSATLMGIWPGVALILTTKLIFVITPPNN